MKIKQIIDAIIEQVPENSAGKTTLIDKLTILDNSPSCTPTNLAELTKLIEEKNIQFKSVEIMTCPPVLNKSCFGLFGSRESIICPLLESLATKKDIQNLTLGTIVTTYDASDSESYATTLRYLLGRKINHLTVDVKPDNPRRANDATTAQFISALLFCVQTNSSLQTLSVRGELNLRDNLLLKINVTNRNSKNPHHQIRLLLDEPDPQDDSKLADESKPITLAM